MEVGSLLLAESAPLVAMVAEPVPAVTYAKLAPMVEDSARTPGVTYVEQVPVDVHNVPAPAMYYTALALVVGYIAPAPADTSSTPVCVGDTGFDTSWSRHCRHCEVFRIGDRDYEGQVRVLHADEGPHSCASGTWIPSRFSGLMESAHVSSPRATVVMWTLYEMATAGPGRYKNAGHMVDPSVLELRGELTMRDVLTMPYASAKPPARLWSSFSFPSFSWPFLTLNVPAIYFVYLWLYVLGSIHLSLPNLRLLCK